MNDDSYLRIGEFSERVGVSPDLLRAWERRYGLLRPNRSTGGYRLYTDADVARVRRMTALVNEGLSAAEAARIASSDSATAAFSSAPTGSSTGDGTAVALSLEAGRERLALALTAFDEGTAHRVFDELLASYALETILRHVVLPYLAWIGDQWERGSLSVGQEHFASSVVRGRLLGLARGWGAGGGPIALLASPPGEDHDLPLIAFGLPLWRRGWRILFLGADTPMTAVRDAALSLRPDLLVLAAVEEAPMRAIEGDLASLTSEIRVLLGGQGASAQFAERVGAEHLDVDPVTAAERIAEDTHPAA